MGDLDIVPVMGSFNNLFPFLLIILCLFNLFNIYGKLLKCLGLKRFSYTENFTDDKIEEGKKLLSRARIVKERQLLSL